MQSLLRSILGLCRRPSVCRVGFAPPRWWPPAPARRDAPLMASASALHLECLDRLSRPWSLEKKSKPHSCIPYACAATKCTDATEIEMMKKMDHNRDPMEPNNVWFQPILANSSHRDGAIYKNEILKKYWAVGDVDITDRNETRLEPMMFSKATKRCPPDVLYCLHFPQHMLQFFSLTLAECSISIGSVQLYGYIAVRDDRDGLLNYLCNHSRDDPIIVQQGSLIPMTGPKRGIEILSPVLIEFDMRIKNGEQEENDLQLIDGAFGCHDHRPWIPVKHHVKGDCGAVDISLAYIEHAVEATIEVAISEVQSGCSLSVTSFVYVMEGFGLQEIQLFHGTVEQLCRLRRFVVAVRSCTVLLLKFRLGNVDRYRTFKTKLHGCASRRIKLGLASISVKVTWSTI